jgi:MFS family permease
MDEGKRSEVLSSVVSTVSEEDIGEAQRKYALALVSVCHALNHLQSSITAVLYPVMMKELGFGFLQLGVLSAVSNLTGQGLQVIYGLLAGFFKRTLILGLGNVILGASTLLHAALGNYPQLLIARVISSVGSSPQHPLGASILSRYFPEARGWALTFHHSAGSVGSFLAPAAVSFLLLSFGWRWVFVVFGLPGVLLGLSLFFLRDWSPKSDGIESKRRAMRAGLHAYVRCLKNRNILFTSFVLMAGAAGRGTGINVTYLVPFFMENFSVSASAAGLLLTVMQGAGLVGPLVIGWLSDRYWKRSFIVQITLILSAIMTVWLPHHSALGPLFFLNLVLYGCFVQARGSLTQAMIGDFATEELADAAFSIYYFVGFMSGPIWTLITGYIVDKYGFTSAFYVAGSTYLIGMALLTFVKEDRYGEKPRPFSPA